jgi:hypothetical protein
MMHLSPVEEMSCPRCHRGMKVRETDFGFEYYCANKKCGSTRIPVVDANQGGDRVHVEA